MTAGSWLGRDVVRLGSVGSTNDEAMARARAGAAHGTVVVADEQTAGRGRQGRTWFSPPGDNLYLSVVVRLPIPPSAAPPITLAAGIAVCEAARSVGARANLKWPNDVQVDGRKLAGILTETSTRGDKLEAIVIGIGINVNTTEFPDDIVATSLRLAVGRPQDRDQVLDVLCGQLATWVDRFAADGATAIAAEWKQRSNTLGRRVTILVDGRAIEGVAVDLDEAGALLVHGDAGERWRVNAGEITS